MKVNYKDPSNIEVFFGCLAIILLIILLIIFSGIIFTFLWNLVIPVAFGGPTLTIIQGIALMLIISIIGSAFRTVVSK